MKMIRLSKETIDKIFEEAKDQYDYMIALYKIAFEDFNDIHFINGFPQVSEHTNSYLSGKSMEFDREKHPDVMNGGMWLNKGFGSNTNQPKDDWMIDVSTCKITYNEPAEL